MVKGGIPRRSPIQVVNQTRLYLQLHSYRFARLHVISLVRYQGYFDLLPLLSATILVFNIFQSKTIWRIRRMYIISDQIMSENCTRF